MPLIFIHWDNLLKVEKFCFYSSNYVVEKTHTVKALVCYLKEEVLISNFLPFWVRALVIYDPSNVGHQDLVNKLILCLKNYQKFMNFESNQRNRIYIKVKMWQVNKVTSSESPTFQAIRFRQKKHWEHVQGESNPLKLSPHK